MRLRVVCWPHLEKRLYSFFQVSAPREPESSERGVNIKHDFGIRGNFGVWSETDISDFVSDSRRAGFDAVGSLGAGRPYSYKRTE
jgi:hypothetical protein